MKSFSLVICVGEFLQKTGSFKSRGALNAVLKLKGRQRMVLLSGRSDSFYNARIRWNSTSDSGFLHLTDCEAIGTDVKGVVTHSSGNHGQALAWAAREAGFPCQVVIPRGAPAVKAKAIGEELRIVLPTGVDGGRRDKLSHG